MPGGVAAAPGAFDGPGPCAIDAAPPIPIPLQLPPESRCGRDCLLQLHLIGPQAAQLGASSGGSGSSGGGDSLGAAATAARAGEGGCAPPPGGWPLLFLYPGFQLKAGFYEGYARRLASWGWVVVMYDLALLDLVPSGVQAGYLPHIMAKLAELASDPGSRWHGRLDLTRLAAAGHSRGGKLAALHLAAERGPRFAAAYLIDPVDSEGGADDPSAVEALRGLNKSFGISAAGIAGPCNPRQRTAGFWEAAAAGSWREVLVHGGHAQFCDISGGFERRALDLLCGRGNDTHEAVIQLTLPPMVAWLQREMGRAPELPLAGRSKALPQARPWQRGWRGAAAQWLHALLAAARGGGASGGVRSMRQQQAQELGGDLSGGGFFEWVRGEVAAGEIEFEIKA